MPSTYKSPGVYVEEISKFPPSVAEVETAIPAFIGYTENSSKSGKNLDFVPVRISSLLEYEQLFGGQPPIDIQDVNLDINNNVQDTSLKSTFLLYDSLQLFFANGGGRCYIISIGDYNATITKSHFEDGLQALEKKDEPTIILFPDAVLLKNDDIYFVQQLALQQSNKLGDRVVVMDLLKERTDNPSFNWKTSYEEFRNKVGIRYLAYGVAYTPYLFTNLDKNVSYRNVKGKIKKLGNVVNLKTLTNELAIQNAIDNIEGAIADKNLYELTCDNFISALDGGTTTPAFSEITGSGITVLEGGYLALLSKFKLEIANGSTDTVIRTAFLNLFRYIYLLTDVLIDKPAHNSGNIFTSISGIPFLVNSIQDIISGSLKSIFGKLNGYNFLANGRIGGTAAVNKIYDKNSRTWNSTAWDDTFTNVTDLSSIYPIPSPANAQDKIDNMEAGEPHITAIFKIVNEAINSIKLSANEYEKRYDTSLFELFSVYRNIIAGIKDTLIEIPPSGAMAGIYASVDNERGVWKAPANVSLNAVKGLTQEITEEDQEELNVDVNAGKSINAIRSFTGKGILVWGARTLAGNDNEWRYISVRRFFNMAEESIKKATSRFVFEPNDANTWIKVRAMIENFLTLQWRAGALAGAKPEEAFFVKIGLGETMTADDVVNGRMIVEIGMAVVRPAEFIILRFSHKMQES